MDSHLPQNGDNHRREERRSASEDHSERHRSIAADKSPTPEPSTSNAESLSIAETNKLRAKLGLKPLEVAEGPGGKCTF